MSDLREAIAQILTEEYPECIKRPSDAYRGADRILDAAGSEGRGLREALRKAHRRMGLIISAKERGFDHAYVQGCAQAGREEIDAALAALHSEGKPKEEPR